MACANHILVGYDLANPTGIMCVSIPHGANMPRLLTSLILLFLSVITLPAFAEAEEKLVFAIDLIRHGDRNPIREIPSMPHEWPDGLGALTMTGALQEHLLGAQMRAYYVGQMHLLPEKYQPGSIHVRSTDINRTKMSADAFLSGLYPVETRDPMQFIPIEATSKSFDPILLVMPDLNPISLFTLYLQDKITWDKKLRQFPDKFSRWEKAFNMSLSDSRDFGKLADNLYVRRLHHIPIPPELTEQDVDDILQLAQQQMVQDFHSKELTLNLGRSLLHFVSDQFQQALRQDQLKYILLSGHDSTILAVMNTLDAPLAEVPPYASRVNFSLFKRGEEYYVHISMNGKPIPIPHCGEQECALGQFSTIRWGS